MENESPPLEPSSEPSPQTRHRLARQMEDPKITLPDAIDLACAKASQLEQYFVMAKGIDAMEMRNVVTRLREAAFWCNEFNNYLRVMAEEEAKPKLVVTDQMPPARRPLVEQ